MAAQALYLKYRPQTFDRVVGQEPITRTLRNALRQGRVRHAYLFAGPRGTGKTTTARLLAKAVNCHAPEEERPCNLCPICVAINEGRLLDLIEIDAASNRGIDEIRDIREKVGFRPNEGRFKVYVLDEAHMLTEPAFNALLKTLEEPPPHVIFTLVTTDPHKIPATIASRCQRFDFKRIPLQAIIDQLAFIAQEEGVTVEPDALELIAHQGTGALRDAISLLDQMTSYGDEISLDQVQMVLGTVASEAAGNLAAFLADGDVAGGLDLINRTVSDGADPRQFGREIVEYLRGLLLIQQGAGTRLLNATVEQAAAMEALAERMPKGRLMRAIRLFNEAATNLKSGRQTIPQLPLEMALVESSLEPPIPQEDPQLGGHAPTPRPTRSSPAPAPKAEPSRMTESPAATVAPATAKPKPRRDAEPSAVTAAPTRAKPTPHHDVEPPAATATPAPAKPTPLHEAEQAAVPAAPVKPKLEPQGKTEPPPSTVAPAEAGRVAESEAQFGALTLERVQQSWEQVLQAVRKENPATQGVLNTGCEPVEVVGDEIVVTFPYPFMREKLGDAQRRTEIQDALDRVLGARCTLKLVLASEFKPRQPARAAPELEETDPAPSSNKAPETNTNGDEVPEQISRWAAEHGAQAKIID